MSLSNDNLQESDDEDEEGGFSTKQLFSFAWQMAKGMVIWSYFLDNVALILLMSITRHKRRKIQKSILYKHKVDGIIKLIVFLDMSTVFFHLNGLDEKIFQVDRSTQFRYAPGRKYLDQIIASFVSYFLTSTNRLVFGVLPLTDYGLR